MAQQVVAASVTERIREVVKRFGKLGVDIGDVDDADDLFRAGMSSFANVNVMLALEATFGFEFPESMLRRSTFESVAAIRTAVLDLLEQGTEQ